MNDAATAGGAPGASLIPSSTDAFTAAHLVVLAIFAIAIIAAIIWGSRLKARRKAAERTIASHNAEVEAVGTPEVAREVEAPVLTRAAEPVPFGAPAPVETEAPAPSVEVVPAPAAEATAAPFTSTSAADAPVGTLKGLGPKLATRLGELGITTVGQIAALSDDEAAQLDAQLGPFAGRVTRDRWVEQARFLAAGDQAGFEAVFGRL